jgi:hypothetical protein
MEQAENGTFQLGEGKEGDTRATNSIVRSSEDIGDRIKRHRIDDNVTNFIDNMNHHITANEATLKILKAPVLSNEPSSTGVAGLTEHVESKPVVTKPNSMKSQSSICVVDHEESMSIIIKQESIESRLGLYVDEHQNLEPVNLKQELGDDVDKHSKT